MQLWDTSARNANRMVEKTRTFDDAKSAAWNVAEFGIVVTIGISSQTKSLIRLG